MAHSPSPATPSSTYPPRGAGAEGCPPVGIGRLANKPHLRDPVGRQHPPGERTRARSPRFLGGVAARQLCSLLGEDEQVRCNFNLQHGAVFVNGSIHVNTPSVASRWITIPPSRFGGELPQLDLYPAATWISVWPPLKSRV